MSYTIELSGSKEFFRIRVEEAVTVELARQWSAELQEMGREQSIRRFLFDVRSSKNFSTVLENYQFAYRDSVELKLKKNVRSAILTAQGDKSHDFVELTMKNAGYNVKVFTEESSAVAWLEENDR